MNGETFFAAVSAIVALGALLATWIVSSRSHEHSVEALETAKKALAESERSNTISQTATVLSREANALSRQAYSAEYDTNVHFHWGRYVDLATENAIGQLMVVITNLGRNPLMLLEIWVSPYDDPNQIFQIGVDSEDAGWSTLDVQERIQFPILVAPHSSFSFYMPQRAFHDFAKHNAMAERGCMFCAYDSTGKTHKSRRWSAQRIAELLDHTITDTFKHLAYLKAKELGVDFTEFPRNQISRK